MLILYGSANSRALRVIWMLGELGIAYKHKDWLPRSPETKTADYLALNANARVPTIDDNGFILSESMAINLYLAKKAGKLYPDNPQDEALAWQWSLWETDRLDRQIVTYVRHTTALPQAERKADMAEAAWKEVAPAFDVLESALARTPWLAGKAFSVAEVNVAGALYRALTMDLKCWPHIDKWLRMCWERPAAKTASAMRND